MIANSNAQAFFTPAANTKPFLKVGARGFAGTGKTYSLMLIAIELVNRLHAIDPTTPRRVAMFDTEKAAGFLRPLAEEADIELIVKESRSLTDWQEAVRVCEAGAAPVLITDSITHIYQGFLAAYQEQKRRKFLEFQDWGIIKPEWGKRFSETFVRSHVHILFTGRAAFEYEQVEVEKPGGGMKKEIQKSGVKMKADADTAYEPDLIIHMDRVERLLEDSDAKEVWRECTVLKDRSGLLDGKTFRNPTGADFRPIIERLISGPKDLRERVEGDDRRLFDDGEESQWKIKRDRTIALEELQGLIQDLHPSQTATDKAARQAIMVEFFETRSWTAIESAPMDKLRAAVGSLKARVEAVRTAGKPSGTGAKDGTDAAPAVSQRVVKPANDIEREQMRRELLDLIGGSDDPAGRLSALAGRNVTTVHDLDDDQLAGVLAEARGE